MTVYELIKKLFEFEPETEVRFKFFESHEQVEVYKEEWAEEPYVGFYGHEVTDIGYNWNNTSQLFIEIEGEDL